MCGSVRMCVGHRVKTEWYGGNVASTGEGRCASKILVGIPEGKRSVGRHRHRWGELLEWNKAWIGLTWLGTDRWQGLMNSSELSGSIDEGNFLTRSGTISFPRSIVLH
jgi:hypothetical protein